GLNLDASGNVWFNEEFANALGELVVQPPAGGGPGPSPPGSPPIPPPAAVIGPSNTAAPTIKGSPRQADTVIASKGSWTNDPTSSVYTWQRCRPRCVDIKTGPAAAYTLAASDIDAQVRVIVTASNAGGSARAGSRGLGPVGPSVLRVKRSLAALFATSIRGL